LVWVIIYNACTYHPRDFKSRSFARCVLSSWCYEGLKPGVV